MVLGVGLITGSSLAMNGRSLVPTRMQSVAELYYETVANMVRENVGQAGMKYFPSFHPIHHPGDEPARDASVLVYGTSHIIVTFALAALVFVVVTAIGFARHGVGYLKLSCPKAYRCGLCRSSYRSS